MEIQRIPQSKYVDAVRWIPSSSSAFEERFIVMALHDYSSDSSSSCIEIHSLNDGLHSSWSSPSRISSLRVVPSQTHHSPLLMAASTFEGSLHFHLLDAFSLQSDLSLSHHDTTGPISAIDLLPNNNTASPQCVTVGGAGVINLVTLADHSALTYRRLFDTQGLVSYTAVKWASPTEFVTGGLGFSLHWWDQRKPGAAVSHFKPPAAAAAAAAAGAWACGNASGIIHSIDIHESRKHVCMAGGSLGTVFAWDLRWQQQPILLSGIGSSETTAHSPSESEVWEVQYDCYRQSTNNSNTSSARILPVLMCSEDGVLSLVEQGEEPLEILAEPCAINSLDINPQNPSDVICSLEWESVVFISRQ